MRFVTTTVLALGLGLAAAFPATAEKLPLNAISSYLNSLKTAQGDFTQINDDGSISTGTIYIKRPGKVRFEYNAPDTGIVIAGSNTVVIYDKKSNQPAETYPLSKTPLSIILAANVNLGQAKMVTGHSYDGTSTTVRAQDPEHPEYGNIELKFTENPVELRQWVINDGNGSQTTVILGDLKKGGQLANSIFDTSGNAPGINR
ncbi:outer membrane lipoprotein carrier protein LolA [Sulfitobacter sp. HGT1]|jgi:outer membrane lipoprotein-sorting protein|uniref:LolA family protein n=1 Tax=unclassified Sulfitobacter TaxID=196795 RepID=UPI0015931C5C|nr:outer membrane lipoprotein carrier protein LolA [Sulfitobacter sp. HGT1]